MTHFAIPFKNCCVLASILLEIEFSEQNLWSIFIYWDWDVKSGDKLKWARKIFEKIARFFFL